MSNIVSSSTTSSPAASPTATSPSRVGQQAWSKKDTTWVLGLYGTAIGAGVLFLPINAGIGGLWPLVLMAVLALPLTFFAHRGLTRFVLSSSKPGADITEVVEEHFGLGMGKLITILYFFAIYPICLLYSVAITNTVDSFMTHQLGIAAPPRILLSLILVLGLYFIVRFGEQMIVKVMSILVYPFILALMVIACYLIPMWSTDFITQSAPFTEAIGSGMFWKTMWLAIPVMVFAFNHSPIISSFSVDQQRLHGRYAEQNAPKVLIRAHTLMVISVMFFTFSCVLSLSPGDLASAKEQNISILSFLANHFNKPLLEWLAPMIAIVAICKSFLGHYLGASEGFKGIVTKELRQRGKSISPKKLDFMTAVVMIGTAWLVATINPSVLGMIESLGGPIIAVLLYLMPMYAISKVPAMRKYSGALSNIFVVIIGLIAISAIFYGFVS